jgi:hypothetical protein
LEEKIDSLIEEIVQTRKERKRDRVFSKVDGLFYVLISLSTFVVGLLITQYSFLRQNYLLLAPIGTLLSMLISFVIGFKGMINDSTELRIWSWCLLFASSSWYLAYPMVGIFGFIFKETLLWRNLALSIFGLIFGLFQIKIVGKFANWTEVKLTCLLAEKVSVWSEIKYKLSLTLTMTMGFALMLSIILNETIQ